MDKTTHSLRHIITYFNVKQLGIEIGIYFNNKISYYFIFDSNSTNHELLIESFIV